MTGTCTLCGAQITVDPDGLLDQDRAKRMHMAYGRQVGEHVERFHTELIQVEAKGPNGGKLVAPARLPNGQRNPNVGRPVFIPGPLTIATQMLSAVAMHSYFQADDPEFNAQMDQFRQVIVETVGQKEPAPKVATPDTAIQ